MRQNKFVAMYCGIKDSTDMSEIRLDLSQPVKMVCCNLIFFSFTNKASLVLSKQKYNLTCCFTEIVFVGQLRSAFIIERPWIVKLFICY